MHEVMAKGILSAQNGMNVYRGCQHGCIYCDSRSVCYQMRHDFEDIEVKKNAPELLEDALSRKRKKCMISTGAMTDPYIPLETELCITRKCLEIIDRYDFGVAIHTKSNRIMRDMDLLKSINRKSKSIVEMTITYSEELCKIVEPNVSTTRERFEVLKAMQEVGIPTVVWLSPILPYINDTMENIEGILDYCVKAGVKAIICFGIGLTLREGNREYYYKKLDKHFPGLKERYIKNYGNAYELNCPNSKELMKYVRDTCSENGIIFGAENIFTYLHEYEDKCYEQITLF